MPDVRSLPLLEQLDLLRHSVELVRIDVARLKSAHPPWERDLSPFAEALSAVPGKDQVLRGMEVRAEFPVTSDSPARYLLQLTFHRPGGLSSEDYHIETPFPVGATTSQVLMQVNALGIEVEKFHRLQLASQTAPLPLHEDHPANPGHGT